MTDDPGTIEERLARLAPALTRAERQLADTILGNYPVSGLGSITEVARKSEVSSATVARMVQKLGFAGFPEFQAALRRELEARITGPIAKRESWSAGAPDTHILNTFAEAVSGNIRQTLAQTDPAEFDAACDLLADPARRAFVAGGRITRVMADYLVLHLQVIRPGVTLIQSTSNAWPHFLLDMAAGDALVVFDIRRYETSTLRLAEMAHERGARIVLMTDQWRSPIARLAAFTFPVRIAAPSAWDSSVATLLLVETLVAAVQDRCWETTRARMERLEEMFDRTRFFRKFT